MKNKTLIAAALAVLLLCGAASTLCAAANKSVIARGKYLVENIGMCADCHSLRNERGEFVKEFWLKGSPIMFSPSVPMPWAEVAPALAGMPTMTEKQAVKFLMTGEKPDGSRLRPPMPEYRLTEEDAKAVVAYLRSLPTGEAPAPLAAKK